MKGADATVTVVNPLRQQQWNQSLLGSGLGSIFHTANWARLLAESYGFHPAYLTLTEHGALRGCLPIMEVKSFLTGKRGVCLSFSDNCPALAREDTEFQILFESVLELGRMSGWRYVEFRGEPFLSDQLPARAYAHHEIELLDDEASMHSRLRKGTASSIRKADKEGVTISLSSSREAVREFYRLHCLTRQRHGLPPQPGLFFDNLHRHVIAEGLGFTALAHYQGKAVAGLICLHFGDRAVWKYGASDDAYRHLSANNLVLWHTIKTCAKRGFKSLSLGRTDLDNDGLLTFKNGWGAVRTPLNYYRYDFAKRGFVGGGKSRDLGAVRQVLRLLPVDVLKLLGQISYRHIG
jgi:hypothetical protein